jgi:Flp pilus assembly protein TadB
MKGLTPGSRLPESVDPHASDPSQDWPDQPERQERRVVVTWHLQQSGWCGRVLGAIALVVLLIWAILFSVLFAVLAAAVMALVLAVLFFVAWKFGRARFLRPNGFGENTTKRESRRP